MADQNVGGEDTVLDDVFASDRDRGADLAAPEPQAVLPPAEAPAPEAQATETAPKEGSPPQGRDPETGRFVPLSELKSERTKRQDEARLRTEAESRAARAEAALEEARRIWTQQQQAYQPQAQKQQPQPEAPDPYVDPEGYWRHREHQLTARFEQQQFQTRLATSEAIMKQAAPDYDQVMQLFVSAAQNNPALAEAVRHAPMPAQYAYETGKRMMALQTIGSDPKAYEERIRKEERERTIAELNKGGSRPQPSFPGTLADAPASGAQGQVMTDEAMMASIFDSNRKRG